MPSNLGTILVGGIIILIVAAILVNMLNKKKNGESGCGCGCSGCGAESACHPQILQAEAIESTESANGESGEDKTE